MSTTHPGSTDATRLRAALQDGTTPARLQTALLAGTRPHPSFVDVLIERCAVEPDLFVRDTLTWALTCHDTSLTVPRLLREAVAGSSQAQSQALHTLSKVGDSRGWSVITPALLRDPDPEVARTAWRVAVRLVPAGEHEQLAEDLCSQLGRGDEWTHRSLSQALAALGDAAAAPLRVSASDPDPAVATHAVVTERLLSHPEQDFDVAVVVAEAQRVAAGLDVPLPAAELQPTEHPGGRSPEVQPD
ncbi:HEAT repeat domain-containing protein [Auraticoccus monumenti]|uniref:HEAT repeat-containing protein n=1 Tax=Auraticoccus monumenti TaxID=675864 RepID=A0A1G7BF97_9ACTN|nr:HEAT repeat domain-containing protein [Auraticoccus monumenti]SDE25410.1 hypothetical protein SAMN04489747_2931 [Auraticoccus monumenti]